MPDFSVVIPVYNSAKFIESIYNELSRIFITLKKSFEVIFVNDASSDNSVFKITELQKDNSCITLIELKKNSGQYVATVCGISHAKGDYIITLDADGSPPPSLISILVDQKNEHDLLIYGEPALEIRSRFRKTGSQIFDAVVRASVRTSVDLSNHSGSSLRMIKKELAEKTLGKLVHPVLLDITLMNLAKDKVKFIPIGFKQTSSTSSYSNIKLIAQGIELLFATMANKAWLRNTINPEHFIKQMIKE